MTAVRLGESLQYATRLFSHLLGVTVLGGVAIVVGLALGWPAVLGPERLVALLGSGGGGIAYAVAGGLLVLVGGSILTVGYIAGAYRLVADAVAAGGGATDGPTAAEGTAETQSVPGLGESAAPATSAEGAGATTESGDATGVVGGAGAESTGADAPDSPSTPTAPAGADEPPASPVESSAGADSTADADGDPPEPTPEEIAFGTSAADEESPAGDEPADDEPAEEPTGGNVRPAASDASSDPLADPTDDG